MQPSILLWTLFIRPATFHSSLNSSYPSCNLPFFSKLFLSVMQPSILLSTSLIRPATFHFSLNSSYPSCNLPFFSTFIRSATFHFSLNFNYPSCNLPFFSKLFLSVMQPSILLYFYPFCNLPFFSTLIRSLTFHFSLNSSLNLSFLLIFTLYIYISHLDLNQIYFYFLNPWENLIFGYTKTTCIKLSLD